GHVSNKGGFVRFFANAESRYSIRIASDNNDFEPFTLTGATQIGENLVPWDGNDGNGNPLGDGLFPATVTVQLQGAEVHFPFMDMEYNRNGTIIELLNPADNYQSVQSD